MTAQDHEDGDPAADLALAGARRRAERLGLGRSGGLRPREHRGGLRLARRRGTGCGSGGTGCGRALRGGRGLRALGAVGALDGTQRRGHLRALLGGLRPGLRAALGGRGRGALRGLGLRRAGLRAVLRPLRGLLRGRGLRGRGLRGLGALRGLTLRGHARATGARRLLGGGARGESTRDGTGGGRAGLAGWFIVSPLVVRRSRRRMHPPC